MQQEKPQAPKASAPAQQASTARQGSTLQTPTQQASGSNLRATAQQQAHDVAPAAKVTPNQAGERAPTPPVALRGERPNERASEFPRTRIGPPKATGKPSVGGPSGEAGSRDGASFAKARQTPLPPSPKDDPALLQDVGGGGSESVPMTEISRAPARKLSEVVRNAPVNELNFVRARAMTPSSFAKLSLAIRNKLGPVARLGLKNVNGLKTNRVAIGPIATGDVSIQLPMTKEDSFNELRDTRIPLPKREPSYAVLRDPRQDMKTHLESIYAKHQALESSEAARLPAAAPAAAGVAAAPRLPLAPPGPITPVQGLIDRTQNAGRDLINREEFLATPGIAKYVADNPGKLEAARADSLSAAALALNKARSDLGLAIAARGKLEQLPAVEGKGKQREVQPVAGQSAAPKTGPAGSSRDDAIEPVVAAPTVRADGKLPLAERPGIHAAAPAEKTGDLRRADEILAVMQARVDRLQTGLTHAMREENRAAIEQLEGFSPGKPADRQDLQRLLQDVSERAFTREAGAKTRPTLPRQEVGAVMEALRGGVREGAAINPAHAVEVLREMRTTPIETLVRNINAPNLTANQQRINKVMSRLGESPYGIQMIKSLAQPEPARDPKAVVAPAVAKAQKIAEGIRAESLRTILSLERLKEDLDPNLIDTSIHRSQQAALDRYQNPATPLRPDQQAQYNVGRSGLIDRDGNLGKLDQVAAVVNNFKTNLEQQVRERNVVRPNGIVPALESAWKAVPQLIADREDFMAGKAAYLQKVVDTTVMRYTPASALNPSSINAFNKTASSYSADVTAKTVVRLDKYLMDLRDQVEAAAAQRISAATKFPITPKQQLSYVNMLADVAAGAVAKDFINAAKNVQVRGRDAENIRPEHLEIQEVNRSAGAGPAEMAIRNKLAELCTDLKVGNVAPGAGPAPNLEALIEAAAARAIPTGGRFPLNQDDLFQQVDKLNAERTVTRAMAANRDDHAQADRLLDKALATKQRFIDTKPARPIETVSVDTMRDMLHTFVQQAELRNKFRITSAKLAEVNLKQPSTAFARAIVNKEIGDGPAHATFGPGGKVRLEGTLGTSQFIEAAYTLDGFEIVIGTETRTAVATGGTISATGGYTGPGGAAKVAGQFDSAGVVETIRHSGVKLSIARSTIGEYSDDEVRAGENRKLVDSLLPRPADDVSAQPDPTAHIMKIMSDCPHVTVNLIDESFDNNNRNENALSAGVYGKAAIAAGTLTAGAQRNDTSRRTMLLDASGNLRTSKASEGKGVSWQGIASLSSNLAVPVPRNGVVGFGLASVSRLSQFEGTASEHKYKLVAENLLTLPANSRDEYEFSRQGGFKEYVDNNYEAVVNHTVNIRYTNGYEHLDDFEKRQCAIEDIEDLKRTVETLEGDEDNLILRNVIAVSNRITDGAAQEYDVLRGEQAVLAQKRERAEPGSALETAIAEREAEIWQTLEALLKDKDNFTTHRLTGSERTSYQETVSLDYFGKVGVLNQSDAQRALFSYPA